MAELPVASGARHRAATVRAAAGEVAGCQRGIAHVDAAGIGAGDRRPDRARRRRDRELVAIGPAAPAQVEDRLARAVARQLGLRAVGVEDPQVRDVAGSRWRREQQHAVGEEAEVRLAEPAHAGGRQLERQLVALDDQVVVAEGLPLLEAHRHRASESRISPATRRRVAARDVDHVHPGELAHPGQLAARVVARSALHRARRRRRAGPRSRAPWRPSPTRRRGSGAEHLLARAGGDHRIDAAPRWRRTGAHDPSSDPRAASDGAAPHSTAARAPRAARARPAPAARARAPRAGGRWARSPPRPTARGRRDARGAPAGRRVPARRSAVREPPPGARGRRSRSVSAARSRGRCRRRRSGGGPAREARRSARGRAASTRRR